MSGDFDGFLRFLESRRTEVKFRSYSFFYPSFILGLLCLCNEGEVSINSEGCNVGIYHYLTRVGFYDILGVPGANIKRSKKDTLIEVTKIDGDLSDVDILNFTKTTLKNLGFGINYKDKENEEKHYSLNWFLAEIIRNVSNHSGIINNEKGAYFMLQTYPGKSEINISIVDRGIGIKDSFKNSDYWNPGRDIKDYIELAFQRGVTSDSEKGAGNGLYFTRELVKATHSRLSFLSGDCIYKIYGDKEEYSYLNGVCWQGVIVDIHINLDNIYKERILEIFGGVYPGYIKEFDELEDIFS